MSLPTTGLSVCVMVMAWVTLAEAAKAMPPCVESDEGDEIRVELAGEWESHLAAELVDEVGLLLSQRNIATCVGPRRAGRGVQVRGTDGNMVLVRIWGRGDPPGMERTQIPVDRSGLPPDAVAFTIARTVDELLLRAQVGPAVPETSAQPQPPPENQVHKQEHDESESALSSAQAQNGALMTWLGQAHGFPSGRVVLFGGLLGIQVPVSSRISVALSLGAGAGTARAAPHGEVQPTLLGGGVGLLWRATTNPGHPWVLRAGPIVNLHAARFGGTATSNASATTGWAATLNTVLRMQLEWFALPGLALVLAIDGGHVLLGAQGEDAGLPVVRISGFTGSAQLGLGVAL